MQLTELLNTLSEAGKQANDFYARTNIQAHLDAIEKLKVYLYTPYQTPPCHRCASLRTESVYDRD